MDSEKSHLVSKHNDETLTEDETETFSTYDVHHNAKQLLNLKETFLVLLGVMLGTGILTMPFVVRQLGVIGWLFSLTISLLIQCTCTILLGKSTRKVLDDNGGMELSRDPYQYVTEKSCGNTMRLVSVIFWYITLLTCCMSLLLLSASILSNLIPISGVSETNVIRVWTSVLVLVLTPITYLGTYSELKLPAVVAVSTGLTAAILVVVNSLLYKFVYAKPGDFSHAKIQNANQIFFIPIGTVMFATAGTFTAANLASQAASPSKLHRPFSAAYSCMFVAFVSAGIVPYLVFGDVLLPNTVSTFHRVINDPRHTEDSVVFAMITLVIEVVMMVHFCMVIVLVMNPLFLHMEETLAIPREFTFKRVGVRTSFMVFCLVVCLLVPHFESVLSLTGGVPFGVIATIIPLLVYTNLFLTKIYQKFFVYAVVLAVTALVVGNLVTSIQGIVVAQ